MYNSISMIALLLLTSWLSLTVCNLPTYLDEPGCTDAMKIDCVHKCSVQNMMPQPGDDCITCICVEPCKLVQCNFFEKCEVNSNNTCAFPPCKLEVECIDTETCPDGLYGPACAMRCETHCKKCDYNNGDCTECENGFYGGSCTYECPNCEDRCDRASGHCIGKCKPNYFGFKCNKHCPLHCDLECRQTNGICVECKNGYYGWFCQKTCTGYCSSGCNQTTGICFQCYLGYTTTNCDKQCPQNCEGRCERLTSQCLACLDGFYGQNCSFKCPQNNCFDKNTCNRDGTCISCPTGYYGSYCKRPCSNNCLGKECAKDNGYCEQGCKEGFTGDDCSEVCNPNCQGLCNECEECQMGFYGDMCEKLCSCGDYCFPNGTCREGNGPSTAAHRNAIKGNIFLIAGISLLGLITLTIISTFACRYRLMLKKEQEDLLSLVEDSEETIEMSKKSLSIGKDSETQRTLRTREDSAHDHELF